MNDLRYIKSIAKELNLNFTEEEIETMLKMLDSGLHPMNLVEILKEIRSHLIENSKKK